MLLYYNQGVMTKEKHTMVENKTVVSRGEIGGSDGEMQVKKYKLQMVDKEVQRMKVQYEASN